MRVTFQKRYRAHKNGDVAAQRRQLPEEERSRGERERERAEREREKYKFAERSRFFFSGYHCHFKIPVRVFL